MDLFVERLGQLHAELRTFADRTSTAGAARAAEELAALKSQPKALDGLLRSLSSRPEFGSVITSMANDLADGLLPGMQPSGEAAIEYTSSAADAADGLSVKYRLRAHTQAATLRAGDPSSGEEKSREMAEIAEMEASDWIREMVNWKHARNPYEVESIYTRYEDKEITAVEAQEELGFFKDDDEPSTEDEEEQERMDDEEDEDTYLTGMLSDAFDIYRSHLAENPDVVLQLMSESEDEDNDDDDVAAEDGSPGAAAAQRRRAAHGGAVVRDRSLAIEAAVDAGTLDRDDALAKMDELISDIEASLEEQPAELKALHQKQLLLGAQRVVAGKGSLLSLSNIWCPWHDYADTRSDALAEISRQTSQIEKRLARLRLKRPDLQPGGALHGAVQAQLADATALYDMRSEMNASASPVLDLDLFEIEVRRMAVDYKTDLTFEPEAIEAIRAAAEEHLTRYFEASSYAAMGSGRRTHVNSGDFHCVEFVRMTAHDCSC